MTTPIEEKGTPWKLDQVEIMEAMMKTGIDPIEAILEAVQNAIDSILPPNEESEGLTWEQVYSLPNEISIQIPDKKAREKHPRSKEGYTFVCSVSDKGLCITKDYAYDIIKFLNAAKGTSTKRRNRWSKGRKGVGMIQFLRFTKKIEIVSQDSRIKRCIYKFDIHMGELNGKSFPYYGDLQYVPSSPDNQKKFGIFHDGTVLNFFNATEETNAIPNLTEQTASKISNTFGLEMLRKPNLIIRINNRKLEAPEYMRDHPEKPIIPELEITGNIYEDKEGLGVIKLHGEGGMWIMDQSFYPRRRCSGYLVCEKWIPDTGRKQVMRDKFWYDSIESLGKFLEQFSELRIGDENLASEKVIMNMIEKFSLKVLAPFLPKVNVQGIQDKKKVKEKGFGNLHPIQGEETTSGYAPQRPRKELDPDRVIIERSPHTRDNTRQHQVGVTGDDVVIRAKEKEDKGKKEPSIIYRLENFDEDVALLDLVREQIPWVMFINRKNPLYALKIQAARGRGKDFIQNTAEQHALILMEIDLESGRLQVPQGLTEYKKRLEQYTLSVLNPGVTSS